MKNKKLRLRLIKRIKGMKRFNLDELSDIAIDYGASILTTIAIYEATHLIDFQPINYK